MTLVGRHNTEGCADGASTEGCEAAAPAEEGPLPDTSSSQPKTSSMKQKRQTKLEARDALQVRLECDGMRSRCAVFVKTIFVCVCE